VHNRRVTHEHLELIDRTRRRLDERALPCAVARPASDDSIAAAEEALACMLPPSYRAFLRHVGALTLPVRLSTIHHFIGLEPSNGEGSGLVERTLTARVENRLGKTLVIVGLGAEAGEWFCIDTDRVGADGECPVFLFDARDNALDQQFYDSFGVMVCEVLTFVLEQLDESADVAADDSAEISGTYAI
jgi:hypothetical protein